MQTLRHYFYDTYANLLYKLNRKEEAMKAMERKAIEHCPEKEKAGVAENINKDGKRTRGTW